jgi:thiol-disulfide isomerase/thioredoxin
MSRLLASTRFVAAFLVLTFAAVPCAAASPTVDRVLDVYRANRDRLNTLHLRLEHVEERTEAFGNSHANQAAAIESLVKQLEAGESLPELERSFGSIGREALIKHLRQSAENDRMFAEPLRFKQCHEFFVDGEDYQVRSLPTLPAGDAQVIKFPESPLNSASLLEDFSNIRIYSRSSSRTPVAHIWPGQSSPDRQTYAMSTSKHIAETQNLEFPPFASAMHPRWDMRHPIDTFYSAPSDRYQVVGEEDLDGRLLAVVDVAVPTELTSGTIDENGKLQQLRQCFQYRAWLDLERGGMPIKLQFWYGAEGKPFDERFRKQPTREMKTTDVRQLENGAWYPAQTEEVVYNVDPSAPSLTAEEWKEVLAGTRQSPPYVVFQRETWTCTNIDSNDPGDDAFFVLHFPEGQQFFDIDAGEVVGALERRPSVKSGEPAPPWKLARWLDGKERSLDDFRGKVVVLDFWGLWCGACRSGTPALVALQEKYQDAPVVFVSIHTAEGDAAKLAERIEAYAKESDWRFLAAIDSGTMSENSTTSCDYGCESFPTELVIGADGLVKYNSSEPPKGLEGLIGKACDEVTPEDEAKLNAFMAEQFQAAGETWPLPEGATDAESSAAMNRVMVYMMSQRIDAALAEIE